MQAATEDHSAYADPADMIADRVRWTRAKLTHHLADARATGVIEGTREITTIDAESIVLEISTRSARTLPNATIAPMLLMARQLRLDARDMDALWLLVCVEVDSVAARICQAFGSNECPDMNLQLLRSLVALPMGRVDALVELGLVEVSTDRRLPLHRRAVRANDRLVEIATGEIRIDRDIRAFSRLERPDEEVDDGQVIELAAAIRSATPTPFLFAIGPDGSGRLTLLKKVAAALDMSVLVVRSRRLSRDASELARQLRVIAREACLFDAIPIFEGLDDDPEHPLVAALDSGLEQYDASVRREQQSARSDR